MYYLIVAYDEITTCSEMRVGTSTYYQLEDRRVTCKRIKVRFFKQT
jgi:hypothetical protein